MVFNGRCCALQRLSLISLPAPGSGSVGIPSGAAELAPLAAAAPAGSAGIDIDAGSNIGDAVQELALA